MMHLLWRCLTFSFLFLLACNGADKKASSSQQPSKLYLDYKVTAQEGAENVVVLLQFRKHGPDDKGIALENGSQVTLDGEVAIADSAREAGVYYEIQRPLATFAGKHLIVFTDDAGNTYEQAFEFNPLTLQGLPPVINRKDLTLLLGAGQEEGKVQVLVTDTSFETADINDEYSIKDNHILIQQEALQKVTNGPITLEVHREQEEKLPNGRLLISYAVKRELEIKD